MTKKKKGSGLSKRQIYMRTIDYLCHYNMTEQVRRSIEYRLSDMFRDLVEGDSEWDPEYRLHIINKPFQFYSVIHWKWCIVITKKNCDDFAWKEVKRISLGTGQYFEAVKNTLNLVQTKQIWRMI